MPLTEFSPEIPEALKGLGKEWAIVTNVLESQISYLMDELCPFQYGRSREIIKFLKDSIHNDPLPLPGDLKEYAQEISEMREEIIGSYASIKSDRTFTDEVKSQMFAEYFNTAANWMEDEQRFVSESKGLSDDDIVAKIKEKLALNADDATAAKIKEKLGALGAKGRSDDPIVAKIKEKLDELNTEEAKKKVEETKLVISLENLNRTEIDSSLAKYKEDLQNKLKESIYDSITKMTELQTVQKAQEPTELIWNKAIETHKNISLGATTASEKRDEFKSVVCTYCIDIIIGKTEFEKLDPKKQDAVIDIMNKTAEKAWIELENAQKSPSNQRLQSANAILTTMKGMFIELKEFFRKNIGAHISDKFKNTREMIDKAIDHTSNTQMRLTSNPIKKALHRIMHTAELLQDKATNSYRNIIRGKTNNSKGYKGK